MSGYANLMSRWRTLAEAFGETVTLSKATSVPNADFGASGALGAATVTSQSTQAISLPIHRDEVDQYGVTFADRIFEVPAGDLSATFLDNDQLTTSDEQTWMIIATRELLGGLLIQYICKKIVTEVPS